VIQQKRSEKVNRKYPTGNKTLQVSTPYTDPENHSAQSQRQTDRQTDDIIMPKVDQAV